MSLIKKISAIALSGCILSSPAMAGTLEGVPGEFSAYTTLVTEYSFRGIAQSDERPALQGGVDWSHDSGFYLGFWGSSVDFNDSDQASTEMDFFGGYSFEPIENLTLDIGGLFYAYPGADSSLNYDFFEIYGSIGYDFDVASVSAGIAYSPEYFGDSGHSEYISLSGEVPLPHDFALFGHVGHQYIDDEAAFGVPDYTDWEAGVQWQYDDLALSLSYIDTSLNDSECADGCDERVVFGTSFAF